MDKQISAAESGNDMKKKQVSSILMLLATAILWGSVFAIIKDSLDEIGPLWHLALRLSIAAVPALFCMAGKIYAKRKAGTVKEQTGRSMILHSLILGTAFFGALCLQNVGQQYTTASKCAFLTATYVAFTPLILLFVDRTQVGKKQLIAAALGLFGAFLLSYERPMVFQKGDVLVLLCGFMYAVHILIADHYGVEDALTMHLGQILTAAVIALIAAAVFEPFPAHLTGKVIFSVTYCGLIEIFLCFFLQLKGQEHTPPALASILLSMEAVFGAIFGMLLLHDQMTPIMITGCVMIFIAAVVG